MGPAPWWRSPPGDTIADIIDAWCWTRADLARLAVIMETYPESPSGFLVTYAGQYHLDRVMQMLGGGGSAGTG